MSEPKDEINWEIFLDNFLSFYNVLVQKNEDFGGLTIYYRNEDVYVRCQLENDKQRIKKLEFGRYNEGWVKGIFINDEKLYLTFLQESSYGEDEADYTLDYSADNKEIIYNFLQIPCEIGWTETEFKLDSSKYYKVIVTLDNYRPWEIRLMDSAQQDLPLPGDKLATWLNMKLGDAFWNKARRTNTKFRVRPMSGTSKP